MHSFDYVIFHDSYLLQVYVIFHYFSYWSLQMRKEIGWLETALSFHSLDISKSDTFTYADFNGSYTL